MSATDREGVPTVACHAHSRTVHTVHSCTVHSRTVHSCVVRPGGEEDGAADLFDDLVAGHPAGRTTAGTVPSDRIEYDTAASRAADENRRILRELPPHWAVFNEHEVEF